MNPIHVTCAIIEDRGAVLAAQRSASMHLPGKWEFPGGKVKPPESLQECLAREIQEELGLEIEILASLEAVDHRYPDKHLILHPFICRIAGGTLTPTEHQRVAFFSPPALLHLDWAGADLPVLEQWLRFRAIHGELPTPA